MRLFPSLNVYGKVLVPDVFFPAVGLPVLVFLVLYLYPFFDKLIYPEASERDHNVLVLPRQQPFNTSFGCATFMFMLVIFVGAGDDVIALATGISLRAIRGILRGLALAAPAITFVVVYLLCKRAQRLHDLPPPPAASEAAAPRNELVNRYAGRHGA